MYPASISGWYRLIYIYREVSISTASLEPSGRFLQVYKTPSLKSCYNKFIYKFTMR